MDISFHFISIIISFTFSSPDHIQVDRYKTKRQIQVEDISIKLSNIPVAKIGWKGNLSSPRDGVVPVHRVPFFVKESAFMGMDFSNFLHFLELWISFFIKIHLLVSFLAFPDLCV